MHVISMIVKDEFGVTWDKTAAKQIGDWGLVDHPIKDMKIGGYKFPTGKSGGRFTKAEKLARENDDCFNLLQMTGVFDTAWHVTDIQDLLMGMALEPDFTNKMLDSALEYNLNIIDQIPDFIDGVRFLEDWGDQRGLIMGPDNWRRFLKPRLKLMYEACRRKGKPVFINSCGNIAELFTDIIELGVNVVDPIQPEVIDLKFIKNEYGRYIVLCGGIGSQSTLPLGTPDAVVKECEERLDLLSKGGMYIMGPA